MPSGSIRLELRLGPVIAVRAPRDVMEALESVEVKVDSDKRSVFQMTFGFSSKSTLNTILLLIGQVGPIVRAIVAVTVNGTTTVLMDGVITHHQVTPDVVSGQSKLTVTGEDVSSVMDHIDFTGFPYPAMPAFARVAAIVAKYAVFGMIPLTIPSVLLDIPNPLSGIPTHKKTDLAYIKLLAEEVGYVFYVDPGPVMGTNIAYWGPLIKVGRPQPALNVSMDAHTNVEALQFSYDGLKPEMPVVFIQNEETKIPIPIPIPGITPLNPPLGIIPAIPKKLKFMTGTAKYSPIRAAAIGLAAAANSSDAVSGSGSLDVLRYGRVLKARSLVGVRGVGQAFNGLYYVQSVTHKLARGSYTQDFTLSRNGLISTLTRVPA